MSPRGFDTVVVGAGTAGCAVAARLSEDPAHRVLLIEAGGSNRVPQVRIPLAFGAQFGSRLDWDYRCEPEPTYGGRVLAQPRGRMLGGSSSMNLMLYIRGNHLDYDDWCARGAGGWSYREVLPFFRRSEHNEEIRDDYHGVGGPLGVTTIPSPDLLSDDWINAALAAGIPSNNDFNGATQDGVGRPQVTQRRGARQDSATAFLRPARDRPNLTILTGALVDRVRLRRGRAVAVEYIRRGRPHVAVATGQIVLCGGTFGSAEILQRSGIGPPGRLRAVGVPIQVAQPAVGANLAEHPLVSIHFESASGAVGLNDVTGRGNLPRFRYLAEWALRRTGKLTSNVGEALAHVRSDPALAAPDLQLLFAPVFFSADGHRHPVPAVTMGASYLTPAGTGSVLICSRRPDTTASVRLNLVSTDEELAACLHALEVLRDIAARRPLAHHLGRALIPGGDRASLVDHIRQTGAHTFHASGSVRMGDPEDSAVDERLRVYGVDGLRVADASVFPIIPRGNTNAPALMVGERCADFIREETATDFPRTTNGVENGEVRCAGKPGAERYHR
ncbi:GMC family oxidoreductase N-terminal domain-containing protein [Amycolatopsis sp. QT-25]|uniref:GMC family oxidoreductase n=1 Tax=Amycolatopsis sp. QT-25 TaxID=3034022 RepID=UPI0023EDF5D9|nr:GMC family oxidoreductase N-terminal domain-containing protein [Amycolatopsis sp. QT-25]WET83082.1 GMC family oxidoreductase N-terminal domain-containing protein [Amycolatopsis sp. QT-25]